MWIWIHHFFQLRIQIGSRTLMWIRADPDPKPYKTNLPKSFRRLKIWFIPDPLTHKRSAPDTWDSNQSGSARTAFNQPYFTSYCSIVVTMWMRATKVKPEKSSTQLVHKEFNYLSNKVLTRYLSLVSFSFFYRNIIETWHIFHSK